MHASVGFFSCMHAWVYNPSVFNRLCYLVNSYNFGLAFHVKNISKNTPPSANDQAEVNPRPPALQSNTLTIRPTPYAYTITIIYTYTDITILLPIIQPEPEPCGPCSATYSYTKRLFAVLQKFSLFS